MVAATVTVVLLPAAQVSLAYVASPETVPPVTTAQVVEAPVCVAPLLTGWTNSVAHPPRMEVAVFALVVVADARPAVPGTLNWTVPVCVTPSRLIAPRDTPSVLLVGTTAETV